MHASFGHMVYSKQTIGVPDFYVCKAFKETGSAMSDDDIDFEVEQSLRVLFRIDMFPGPMFAPQIVKLIEEPRCYREGNQYVPIDRVYIARQIRDRFGADVACAVMDHHPLMRLH